MRTDRALNKERNTILHVKAGPRSRVPRVTDRMDELMRSRGNNCSTAIFLTAWPTSCGYQEPRKRLSKDRLEF